ncbi:MAG: hypothetical protein AB7P18_36440 [Candidatus Binatia bacterium]
MRHELLFVGVINNTITQPQDMRVFNGPSQSLLEDIVIQRGEKLYKLRFNLTVG